MMSLIENIQKFAGRHLLIKNFDANQRDVIVNNIDAVSSIGILFTVENEATYRMVSRFSLLLKKEGVQNVHMLGYVEEKALPSYLNVKLGQDFLLKKELNWFLKPCSTTVDNFMHEPFDILIDLTTENILPLHYVLGKSRAHLKVGKGNCGKDSLFDLMINAEPGIGVENLGNQILHYLKQINKVDGDVIAMLR